MSSASATNTVFFLSQVLVHDFRNGRLSSHKMPIDVCEERTRADGRPHVVRSEDRVLLSLPVFCGRELRSIVTLIGSTNPGISGVFEVWAPTGAYQDLKLTECYFGHLERFQNVSSHVCFEIGSGLPGQAAKLGHALIHDDLQNHPGFLRAAGASAGELQTAIAFPIFSPDFVASVLLISSRSTPLAKWIEVWKPNGGQLELVQVAQTDLSSVLEYMPEVGKQVPMNTGILGEVVQQQTAVVSNNSFPQYGAGRSNDPHSEQTCLAIPTFRGSSLKSICLLWL